VTPATATKLVRTETYSCVRGCLCERCNLREEYWARRCPIVHPVNVISFGEGLILAKDGSRKTKRHGKSATPSVRLGEPVIFPPEASLEKTAKSTNPCLFGKVRKSGKISFTRADACSVSCEPTYTVARRFAVEKFNPAEWTTVSILSVALPARFYRNSGKTRFTTMACDDIPLAQSHGYEPDLKKGRQYNAINNNGSGVGVEDIPLSYKWRALDAFLEHPLVPMKLPAVTRKPHRLRRIKNQDDYQVMTNRIWSTRGWILGPPSNHQENKNLFDEWEAKLKAKLTRKERGLESVDGAPARAERCPHCGHGIFQKGMVCKECKRGYFSDFSSAVEFEDSESNGWQNGERKQPRGRRTKLTATQFAHALAASWNGFERAMREHGLGHALNVGCDKWIAKFMKEKERRERNPHLEPWKERQEIIANVRILCGDWQPRDVEEWMEKVGTESAIEGRAKRFYKTASEAWKLTTGEILDAKFVLEADAAEDDDNE